MEKDFYKMKGIEYFPALGEIKYMKRVSKHAQEEKEMNNFLYASKLMTNAVIYHVITGVTSIFLLSMAIPKGIECLIK